jgi:hypothetical protein
MYEDLFIVLTIDTSRCPRSEDVKELQPVEQADLSAPLAIKSTGVE